MAAASAGAFDDDRPASIGRLLLQSRRICAMQARASGRRWPIRGDQCGREVRRVRRQAMIGRAGPLRVLFINDTARNGGPGGTLLDILKFLDPDVIHRSVLLPRADVVNERLLDAGAADSIRIDPDFIENLFQPFARAMERRDFAAPLPLRAARAAGNVARALLGLTRLARRARAERTDLLFCNGTAANVVGGLVAAATGVPALWHVFYPDVSALARPLHRRLAAGRAVHGIICVSAPTALQFAHCGEKVRVVHDALDVGEFDAGAVAPVLRRELGVGADTVIFGSHGRILPRKGFVALIQAARIVLDRLDAAKRARCRFVVLGDTPQDVTPDHLAECRTMVREMGLEAEVRFVGFRREVRPYLADFDVSLVPSVYEDPLPRAVLESMAMAKPVIAFDVGGIGEMIDDGIEGRLLRGRPPDIAALAEACLDVLADPEAWRLRGLAARRRIERDFDARAHARTLQEAMLRAAGRAPAAARAAQDA